MPGNHYTHLYFRGGLQRLRLPLVQGHPDLLKQIIRQLGFLRNMGKEGQIKSDPDTGLANLC